MGDNYGNVKLNVSLVRLSAVLEIDAGGVAFTEISPSKTKTCCYIIIDEMQQGTRTSDEYKQTVLFSREIV